MKQIFKKNQVIIAALAVMIVIAGYLQFTQDKIPDNTGESLEASVQNGGEEAAVKNEGDTSLLATATPTGEASLNEEDSDSLTEESALSAEELELTDSDPASVSDTNELVENENNTENDSKEKDSAENQAEGEDSVAESAAGEAVLASNSISSEFFAEAKLNREQTRAKSKEMLEEIISNTDIAEEQKQEAINEMIKIGSITDKETLTETLLEAKGFPDAIVTIIDDEVEVIVNANNLTEQQLAQIEDIVKRKTDISAEHIVISPASVLEKDSAEE